MMKVRLLFAMSTDFLLGLRQLLPALRQFFAQSFVVAPQPLILSCHMPTVLRSSWRAILAARLPQISSLPGFGPKIQDKVRILKGLFFEAF